MRGSCPSKRDAHELVNGPPEYVHEHVLGIASFLPTERGSDAVPYSQNHKAETRQRIVTSARRLFNHRGFTAVSIDEIMAEAGLTRGGFYHHFKTKDELYVEAVLEVLRNPPALSWKDVPFDMTAPAPACALQMIEAYLSPSHIADKDGHCPMIALPSDVARAGPEVRAAYEQLLKAMGGVIASGIDGNAKDKRALAIAALCVGGMVLARTVNDAGLADAIREAARSAALEIGAFDDVGSALSGQADEPNAKAASGSKPSRRNKTH